MTAQKVGHVEGRHVVFRDFREVGQTLIECEAVRPGDPLDAMRRAYAVEVTTCAAIGVAYENTAIALRAGFEDCSVERRRDPVGSIVEFSGKASQVEVIESRHIPDRNDFPRDHSARDNENLFRIWTLWRNGGHFGSPYLTSGG
jgi:hypothetical protein